MTLPAAADDYKANYLHTGTTTCQDSQAWLDIIDNIQKGDWQEANMMMRQNKAAGRCSRRSHVVFKPEAIVAEWDNDGTGTPGVIVAGFIMLEYNKKGPRVFLWLNPELLEQHFAAPPET